ncbi:MAG: AzlC family ABC transporter permease [Lachnospiraceae bacterium]|nr:AzlC family ABC transporter permease [Lachnospiraceae bacterium]
MNARTIKQAFYRSIPVMAGYIVLGIGFGILIRNAGYGVLWTSAMSLFIYAGSMQFVGVGLIAGGASILTTAITTFMVNARHLFYSISMVDKYKDAGRYKPYMIFALTDETYSLLCDAETPEGTDPNQYRFFVSLFNQSYWVTGSLIGSLLGAVLPFSTAGIEFSMTALFTASFTEQWLTTKDHVPALTGLLCTLLCLIVFGRDRFLIPAMLLITLVLTILRRREEGMV